MFSPTGAFSSAGNSATDLAADTVSFGAAGVGAGGTVAFGISTSSRTSLRNSPSSVNKRRSVTVKPESCLFSAIASVLVNHYFKILKNLLRRKLVLRLCAAQRRLPVAARHFQSAIESRSL